MSGLTQVPTLLSFNYVYGTITLYRTPFQTSSTRISQSFGRSYNPAVKDRGLGSSHFARRYYGNLVDFFSSAYLDVSVRRVSLHNPMYSDCDDGKLLPPGCPIRNPSDQRLFRLPEDYRRFTRPSSPVDAKASTSSPYKLNHTIF